MKSSVIANLLVALYNGDATQFDQLEPGNGDSGICWASKVLDGATLILLRGSVTLQDWLRDLMAVTTPWEHDTFGPVHPGFALGMDRCWSEIQSATKGPYIVAGHSLGAGRAAILTGLMIEGGIKPLQRVVFGEPKPGFAKLGTYISIVPGLSYRNGAGRDHDYVTDVPASFPPEEYVHPGPLTDVTAAPTGDLVSRLGLFAYHHMPLYAAAVEALESQSK